ncbi:MAG: TIGR00341 family protein, partial [Bacteroides sp.]
DFYKDSQIKLQDQQNQIRALERAIQRYKEYTELSAKIAPELSVLYPSVQKVSISQVVEVDVETQKPDTVTLAIVRLEKELVPKEQEKLEEWLKKRVESKKLRLIVE